ncbi:NF038132 family protein [Pseudoduganella plicata]|uniref:Uncharacterized protein n=1 Tax=Pseudoduganella plicata TaxID=321984 RepID=A0AA87YBR0_9BURK|nr:NF038132 family protein [Pseudoduganella plicata]GGY85368.1 hypothetical protein GCM10007388_18290 [Pseudoduganella plicata]
MNFHSVSRLLAGGMLALLAQGASAQIFDNGLPASWQCTGACGVSEADGDVQLAPNGGTHYGWISTYGGAPGVLLPGVNSPADSGGGSLLRSHLFTAAAGQALTFQFNYVTTDAGDFTDYAWVRLIHADGNQAALLVTARTSPGGGAVPGFGMPPPAAWLTPSSSTVSGPPPFWSPLGADSGTCYVAVRRDGLDRRQLCHCHERQLLSGIRRDELVRRVGRLGPRVRRHCARRRPPAAGAGAGHLVAAGRRFRRAAGPSPAMRLRAEPPATR